MNLNSSEVSRTAPAPQLGQQTPSVPPTTPAGATGAAAVQPRPWHEGSGRAPEAHQRSASPQKQLQAGLKPTARLHRSVGKGAVREGSPFLPLSLQGQGRTQDWCWGGVQITTRKRRKMGRAGKFQDMVVGEKVGNFYTFPSATRPTESRRHPTTSRSGEAPAQKVEQLVASLIPLSPHTAKRPTAVRVLHKS